MSEPEGPATEAASMRPEGRTRCERHGLWFDARVADGCVVCRRPAPSAPALPDAPTRPNNLRRGLFGPALAVAAAAGLFVYVLLGGRLDDVADWALGVDPAPATPAAPAHMATASRTPRGAGAVPAVTAPASEPRPDEEDHCARIARGGEATVTRNEWPPGGLHGAAARGDVARIVQDLDLDAPKDERDDRGRTPLAWALLAAQAESARVLIEDGANPNLGTYDEVTPLMLAARGGMTETVRRLIAAGARPGEVDRSGETALMLAARYARAETVAVLAQNRSTLAIRCERGMTALHHAAEGSTCTDAVAALLAAGADVDARDGQGATALLVAARAGHAEVVALLLEHGAALDARDNTGLSALDHTVAPRSPQELAAAPGLRTVFDLLVARGIDRRLGLDPESTPILFRSELDALARREGRPELPAYRPDRATRADGDDQFASRPLLPAVPRTNSKLLPSALHPQVLLAFKGWQRVPNVLARAVLQQLSLHPGQRVRLSGDARGRAPWRVDDVLLLEPMHGSRQGASAFLGRVDQLMVDQKPALRLGPQTGSFAADAVDLAPFIAASSSADNIRISALDYGSTGELSNVFLVVEGPRAAQTLARASVEAVPLTTAAR